MARDEVGEMGRGGSCTSWTSWVWDFDEGLVHVCHLADPK
jgi:hypothetical protein